MLYSISISGGLCWITQPPRTSLVDLCCSVRRVSPVNYTSPTPTPTPTHPLISLGQESYNCVSLHPTKIRLLCNVPEHHQWPFLLFHWSELFVFTLPQYRCGMASNHANKPLPTTHIKLTTPTHPHTSHPPTPTHIPPLSDQPTQGAH